MTDARLLLAKIAAECHRAKWQFDLSEDYKPKPYAARGMILSAFNELHRIGDLAMKYRDALRDEPQSIPGCLHQIGPLSCQNHGKCQTVACNHYGKTECRPRMTVLAQVDGIVYPRTGHDE